MRSGETLLEDLGRANSFYFSACTFKPEALDGKKLEGDDYPADYRLLIQCAAEGRKALKLKDVALEYGRYSDSLTVGSGDEISQDFGSKNRRTTNAAVAALQPFAT